MKCVTALPMWTPTTFCVAAYNFVVIYNFEDSVAPKRLRKLLPLRIREPSPRPYRSQFEWSGVGVRVGPADRSFRAGT